MGNTLTGERIQATYDGLIKVGDNEPITGTLKRLSDGLGNDLPLLVSTTSLTNYGAGAVTSNTAFGDTALDANTTGFNNVAIGSGVLGDNTTGASNTAIGVIALRDNSTGASNTAVGLQALLSNTTSSNNTSR